MAIEQIEVASRPTLERVEQDPPSVGRRARPHDVLFRTALAEHRLVASGVVAKPVEPHPAVVMLVAGRDRSRGRIRGVIETLARPRDGRTLRMRNALGQLAAGRDLDDVERRHLVATTGQSVGDVARVVRWKVPVDGHQTGRVECVGIHQRAVLGVERVAHVEDRLALRTDASRVEHPAVDRMGRGQEADGQELAQPSREMASLWQCVEDRPGTRVLRFRPGARAFAIGVLEPAVRIDDALAMPLVRHLFTRRRRRRQHTHPLRLMRRQTARLTLSLLAARHSADDRGDEPDDEDRDE